MSTPEKAENLRQLKTAIFENFPEIIPISEGAEIHPLGFFTFSKLSLPKVPRVITYECAGIT